MFDFLFDIFYSLVSYPVVRFSIFIILLIIPIHFICRLVTLGCSSHITFSNSHSDQISDNVDVSTSSHHLGHESHYSTSLPSYRKKFNSYRKS